MTGTTAGKQQQRLIKGKTVDLLLTKCVLMERVLALVLDLAAQANKISSAVSLCSVYAGLLTSIYMQDKVL